jgi:hypothetical protein
MATFRNWSNSFTGPVVRFAFPPPRSLQELRGAVLHAERDGLTVHAVGSAWAFSSPAYCEGVMIETTELDKFSSDLQASILPWARPPTQRLVAVEAGIKIRNLDHALEGLPRPDGRPGLPPGLLTPQWTLPTHGGCGGQSIAGAISTGTHGGDVGRGALSNYVHAMVVVGSGGVVRLIQPTRPVVDWARYQSRIPTVVIRNHADDAMLDAAVVSVGRFGVVYAYVLEVHHEADQAVFQYRYSIQWSDLKLQLLAPMMPGMMPGANVVNAAAGDEYLGFVTDPARSATNDRKCYVTRQKRLPETRVSDAGTDFDLGGIASTLIGPQRDPPSRRILSELGQVFCAETLTPQLQSVRVALDFLGVLVAFRFFPYGVLIGLALWEASRSLGRIGPTHRLGDVVAELLNLATHFHLPEVLELVNGAAIASGQPVTLVDQPNRPWLVHGRRWEIADGFNYDLDCYRGDSVEIFFNVDTDLISKIEEVFQIFNDLRDAGTPVGAYIAFRFTGATRAMIGLAAGPSTACSIEVSMLRGLEANAAALIRLQDLTVRRGGRIHWGQQNDLVRRQVDTMYSRIGEWRAKLWEAEGSSLTFSTPFTRSRGLEPDLGAVWTGWTAMSMIANGSPAVVSAAGGRPLEVLVTDAARVVRARGRPISGPDPPWRLVRPEPLYTGVIPVAVRSADGRIEIFGRAESQRIVHTWEEGQPGGTFAGWDVIGGGDGPRINGDPAVAVHAGGRLEVFGQGDPSVERRLLHAWARWTNGPWSGLFENGGESLGSRPSVCVRPNAGGLSISNQLVVVAAIGDDDWFVHYKSQVWDGGSGWSPWWFVAPAGGSAMKVSGVGSPVIVHIFGPGGGVRVFAIDINGEVFESLDEDRTVALTWSAWRPLPPLPPGMRLNRDSRLATVQSRTFWLFGLTQRGAVVAIPYRAGGGWGTWQSLGGYGKGDVAAGFLSDSRIEVFVHGADDDELRARRQAAPDVW